MYSVYPSTLSHPKQPFLILKGSVPCPLLFSGSVVLRWIVLVISVRIGGSLKIVRVVEQTEVTVLA